MYLIFEDEDQFIDEDFGTQILVDAGRTFARRLVVDHMYTVDMGTEQFKVTRQQWFVFFNEIGKPEMTQKLSGILKKYKGKEAKLLAETKKQYGSAPDPEKYTTVDNDASAVLHEKAVLIRGTFGIKKSDLPIALFIEPPAVRDTPTFCSNTSWCPPNILRDSGMDSAQYHMNVSNSFLHNIAEGKIKGMEFTKYPLAYFSETTGGKKIKGKYKTAKDVIAWAEDFVLPPEYGMSNLKLAVGLVSEYQTIPSVDTTRWPTFEIKNLGDWVSVLSQCRHQPDSCSY
jgi:hypothetical protein